MAKDRSLLIAIVGIFVMSAALAIIVHPEASNSLGSAVSGVYCISCYSEDAGAPFECYNVVNVDAQTFINRYCSGAIAAGHTPSFGPKWVYAGKRIHMN